MSVFVTSEESHKIKQLGCLLPLIEGVYYYWREVMKENI